MTIEQVSQRVVEVGQRNTMVEISVSQRVIEVGQRDTYALAQVSQRLIEIGYQVAGTQFGPLVAHM